VLRHTGDNGLDEFQMLDFVLFEIAASLHRRVVLADELNWHAPTSLVDVLRK
jgi:hypothetical protein